MDQCWQPLGRRERGRWPRAGFRRGGWGPQLAVSLPKSTSLGLQVRYVVTCVSTKTWCELASAPFILTELLEAIGPMGVSWDSGYESESNLDLGQKTVKPVKQQRTIHLQHVGQRSCGSQCGDSLEGPALQHWCWHWQPLTPSVLRDQWTRSLTVLGMYTYPEEALNSTLPL